MKKKNVILTAVSALAAGMALTATVGSAWAYFTTYTSASGGYVLELEHEAEIVETYSEHTKHLSVSNEGAGPVYVRARAFSGSQYGLTYSGDGWQAGGDGYYYYNAIVPGTSTAEDGTVTTSRTSQLDITIRFPEDAEEGDDCNVVVIYESLPVQYDENGNALAPQAADWTAQVVTGRTEGGND